MPPTKIRLTRKQLYEEIWNISVAGVSKKYGIPYAKCLATIKAAQVPVPPSGYWTKLNYGKSVEQTPLSGDGDAVIELIQETLPGTTDTEKHKLQEKTASGSSRAPSSVETTPQKPPETETAQMTVNPLETIEKFGRAYNVYHRETLYQEVWSMPVTEVAKRYKVSDVAIHKVCKSLDRGIGQNCGPENLSRNSPSRPEKNRRNWEYRLGSAMWILQVRMQHLWRFYLKKSDK